MKQFLKTVYIIICVVLISNTKLYSQDFFKEKSLTSDSFGISTVNQPSVLIEHQNENQNEKLEFSDKWANIIFFVIFFSFFIFLVIEYQEEIIYIIKASINIVFFRQILTQTNNIISNVFLFFNIFFLILLSSFIFSFLKFQNFFPYVNSVLLFLIILTAIILYYFLKKIIVKIWSYIFENNNIYKIYNLSDNIFKIYPIIFLIVFLFFINYILKFTEEFYFISILFLIIYYLFTIFRMFQDFFYNRYTILYLILYLCTVEILPILALFTYYSIT